MKSFFLKLRIDKLRHRIFCLVILTKSFFNHFKPQQIIFIFLLWFEKVMNINYFRIRHFRCKLFSKFKKLDSLEAIRHVSWIYSIINLLNELSLCYCCFSVCYCYREHTFRNWFFFHFAIQQFKFYWMKKLVLKFLIFQ